MSVLRYLMERAELPRTETLVAILRTLAGAVPISSSSIIFLLEAKLKGQMQNNLFFPKMDFLC